MTGFHFPFCCCRNTAPRPYSDASAETLVSAALSYQDRTGGEANSDMNLWKVLS